MPADVYSLGGDCISAQDNQLLIDALEKAKSDATDLGSRAAMVILINSDGSYDMRSIDLGCWRSAMIAAMNIELTSLVLEAVQDKQIYEP